MTEISERLSQNYDVHVFAEIDDELELEPEKTLSFVRIFQEAVSNAVRHGEATEVGARLFREGGKLVFEVQDNGKGFLLDASVNHENLRLEGHRGLANMTERMLLMGGTFSAKSEVGKGTRLRCTLNLSQTAQESGD